MRSAISRAALLCLASTLALTATLLLLFAFLAPTYIFHDRVAFVTVSPSTELVQQGPAQYPDGPNAYLGLLGSCVKAKSNETLNCTSPRLPPMYDLSAFPKNASSLLLNAPSALPPVITSIALAFDGIFLITFVFIGLHHTIGQVGKALATPRLQNISAGIGVFGYAIKVITFPLLYVWFNKAVRDFNTMIQLHGSDGPKLIAHTGNAFTMIWIAFAFWAVPLGMAIAKSHVTP